MQISDFTINCMGIVLLAFVTMHATVKTVAVKDKTCLSVNNTSMLSNHGYGVTLYIGA